MNILFKMIILITSLSVYSIADAWRIEGGAGLWDGASNGTILHHGNVNIFDLLTLSDQEVTDTLGDHQDKTAGYLYVMIKHPIPVVPNVRFEYVGVKSGGEIVYTKEILFGSTSVTADSQLFITQYDTILFYNLLDNTFWTTLDLGVDIKYAQTQYYVPDLNVDEISDSIIPMAYIRGRVEAPFAPVGLESDIKYITDGESTVYDIRVKVDYSFEMNAALEPGIELGYRVQKFKVYGEESNYLGDVFFGKSDTDVTFAGVYGGITVKF